MRALDLTSANHTVRTQALDRGRTSLPRGSGPAEWPSAPPARSTEPLRKPYHDAPNLAVGIAAQRPQIVRAIMEHGSQAGHSQVLSADPWAVLWSADRTGFLAYLERRSAILAWRDPIAPRDRFAELVASLAGHARARGKAVVIVGASETLVRHASAHGLRAMRMGAEHAFCLRTFSTGGKSGAKVRQALNHAHRSGCVARELCPTTASDDWTSIAGVLSAWQAERKGLRSRSFLRSDPSAYPDLRRYFGVFSSGCGSSIRAEAVVVCSPVNERTFYLQDLMRRPDAPRGALELAVTTAFRSLGGEAITTATTGIVPFLEARRSADSRPWLEAATRVFVRNFIYQFDGLQRFREKFPASATTAVYALYQPTVRTVAALPDIVSMLSP